MTIVANALKMGAGELLTQSCGMVQVNRYVGKFVSANLQNLADTDEWYTLVVGNGQAVRGSGSTPALAVQDAIARNLEKAVTHIRACHALASVYGEFAAAEGRDAPLSGELKLDQLERLLNTLYAHQHGDLPEGTVAKRLRTFVEQLEQRAAAADNPGGEK